MPTFSIHTPQEISVLYGRLPQTKQQQVFDYIINIATTEAHHKTRDLSKYFGKLKLQQNPLFMQKAMRDEWN